MDRDVFMDRLFQMQQRSAKTVMGALLEVGAKSANDVKPEYRRVVLNICERRLPRSGRRYLVQDDTVVGESDFSLRKHDEHVTEGYSVEGGGYGIERE